MRAIPTISTTAAGNWAVTNGSSGGSVSSFAIATSQSNNFILELQAVSTGLTPVGHFVRVEAAGTTAADLRFDAEL